MGICLNYKIGDYVHKGDTLATIYYNEKEITDEEFLSSYKFSQEKIEKSKLIIDVIK